MVWEIKKICCDLAGLRAAHLACNAADNRGKGFRPLPPLAEIESEPLVPTEFVNQKTGARETFLTNSHTILSPEWVAA